MSALLLSVAFTHTVFAQTAAEQKAVKRLCGCFEVDFKYAETFAADTAYKYHPRYHVGGLEWVTAEEAGDKKTVIQHLLVADDSMIIKHWREDWVYEQHDWWQFTHDASWKQVTVDKAAVKGQWTQTVWEVDDAPRYQGSSKWISNDGKYYWENTTDAPLPRREYTKRKDYNVMQRTNRIIVTDTGWLHEQDNKKLVRTDGGPDRFLAEEKGYNRYVRVDDSKCKQAAAWWQKHRVFWSVVRQSWEELLKGKQFLHLQAKVDDKLLYEQLDELEDAALPVTELKTRVQALLAKYAVAG